MTARQTLLAYRGVFLLFILVASAQTLIEGLHQTGSDAFHLVGLASAEIVGALLFLIRPSQKAGAVILLLVFAAAAALTAAQGGNPLRFAYFAGTVLFILHVDASLNRPGNI
jgi:ABC-type uncharacterized transport system permease subunit